MLFSPILVPPAYLDPGSGSIIIQLTIAALLGLGVLSSLPMEQDQATFQQKKYQ